MKALIDSGIDLTVRNEDGNTALHIAAAKVDNAEIVTKLLNAGSDINAIGKSGATSLHYAAQAADKEMDQVLQDWEADTTAEDTDGKSALHWAAQTRYLEVAPLLRERVRTKDKPVVQITLDGIESMDEQGLTVLLLAALDGNLEAVRVGRQRGGE